ncbi:MAG: hypothetical protein HFG54_11235 [Lachnospiraceae bacterium]|jgi:hypothetical protein|nr:hypothetical protein [Lachnospiraceae bacterium]
MLVEEMEQKQRRKEKNQKEPKAYSNVMMISIRKGEQGEPEGEIIHFNLLNPVPYQGIKDLGFRIDEIARFFNLPESSWTCHTKREYSDDREAGLLSNPQEYRSLRMDLETRPWALQREFFQIVPTEWWKSGNFKNRFPAKKSQEIVYMELLGAQNMSLQGRLRCRSTRERYVYFRSALELMYFFAQLLQETGEEKSKRRERVCGKEFARTTGA